MIRATVSRLAGNATLWIWLSLVAAGVTARISLQDLPNFAPVAALALFAGYYFRSWKTALSVPLAVMLLSDLVIGGYDWRMMSIVYAALAAPVAWRWLLRRHLQLQKGELGSSLATTGLLCGCGLVSSILFFLTTNFACWLTMDMYELSWSGLVHCYAQALPFFRYTLSGDVCFAVLLFGSYSTSVYLGWARGPAAERLAPAA